MDAYDTLGRTWVSDRPWKFVSSLTAIGNRMGGSEGERRAAALVADTFAEAGVEDVRTESFPMKRWTRGETELELLEPDAREFEAIALPYSPSGTVEADLVDVGYGTPEEIDAVDIEGKVVVASTTTPEGGRFIHRMEKFG